MFTDTHSHIHFSKEFPDIETIFEHSETAQVNRQIIVGCTPKDSYEALEFVKKYADKKLWSTLGVHPHNANEWDEEILKRFTEVVNSDRAESGQKTTELASTEPKIVALGEMGLDYFRNLQSHEVQQKAFRGQLQLARELDLAVVVHVRNAWEDALKILQEEGNTKVILHCFTGDLACAQQCWEKGYYTSFSGVVTYPKNDYLREIARQAPIDKILIETDCPYLTPQPYRGKRNEPAFVVETAKELAKARGIPLEQMAQITTKNAMKIFNLHP